MATVRLYGILFTQVLCQFFSSFFCHPFSISIYLGLFQKIDKRMQVKAGIQLDYFILSSISASVLNSYCLINASQQVFLMRQCNGD